MSCSVSQDRQPSTVSSIRAATRRRRGSGALPALGRRPSGARSPTLSPSLTVKRGAHRAALDLGRDAGAHDDLVRAAERAAAVLGLAEERPHEAVLGPRRELHDEVDRARDTLDRAQELVRRVEPEVVAALPSAKASASRRRTLPVVGRERRLEDERVRQRSGARVVNVAGRADRPVPGVGVEDAREHGGAVEPRQAQPVDRAVACRRARRCCSRRADRSRRSASSFPLSGSAGVSGRSIVSAIVSTPRFARATPFRLAGAQVPTRPRTRLAPPRSTGRSRG